jgi:hypothetical protein
VQLKREIMKGQISESILYMQIPLPKNASNCAITKGLETILPIEHQNKILDPKLISTNIPPSPEAIFFAWFKPFNFNQ